MSTPRSTSLGIESIFEVMFRNLTSCYTETMYYQDIGAELKRHFGQKVIKLSIDGGFTCPNRDGTRGVGGCTFCSSSGSGEFAGNRLLPIHEQMKQQIELLSAKWKDAAYIAYFQNFTNTYADPQILRAKYEEALSFPGVVGLAIATRPDCLGEEVLALLEEFNQKTYLWVELGIQTSHDDSARAFNRGYERDEATTALEALHARGIRTVAHVIIGLPGEDREHWFQSIDYLVKRDIWGLKIHVLNVLKGTALASHYAREPFPLPTRDEYIALICDILETLPKDIVLHRLTGDGSKEDLIAPLWVRDKRAVLNGIAKEMRRRRGQ